MKTTYQPFLIRFVVLFLALGTFFSSMEAQVYRFLKSDPPFVWTNKQDPTSNIRVINKNSIQYTCTFEGEQYSYGFSWSDPDPQLVLEGGIVGIQLNPVVLEQGRYFIGCSMGTEVEGITNGNRRINPGKAGAGRSGSTGQLYTHPDMAKYQFSKADERDITITLWGGAGNDAFILARFYYQKIDQGPVITAQIQLETPVYTPNVLWDNTYWMGIRVPGWIHYAKGKSLWLIARFYTADGKALPANNYNYQDADGHTVAAYKLDAMPDDSYATDALTIYIPYYALGLQNSGGQFNHSLKFYVEVFVDGRSVSATDWVPFGVIW